MVFAPTVDADLSALQSSIVTTMVATTTDDLVVGLRGLGLTEYEGRAFVALLEESGRFGYAGSSGYEVAKRSGVPRAKIYEVLRALGEKGAAYTHARGERTVHFPVEPSELLRRHLEEATRVTADLGPALDRLRGDGPSGPQVVTVEGYTAVLAKVDEMARAAERRLFVAGLACHVERIADVLATAERRGVRTYVVSYGPVLLPAQGVFVKHPVSDDEPLDAGVLWLIVVADNAQAVISQPAPEPTESAIWTNLPALADMAGEFVRQQIFATETFRLLDERGINLNSQLAPLQAMWFNDRLGRT
jgi:sugar-specific transcriptional regulator TrmB